MRQTTLILGLLLCGNAFAVDPQLMNLVMPDAKILAGANMTTTISSPLGQFLLTKIASSGNAPQGVFGSLGFNPLQDVTEILAASPANQSQPGGLILARGTFPVDSITALVTSQGAGSKWQLSTYGGATLITLTGTKAKVPIAVAFLGNSIAILGDLTSVKAAIDRSTAANSIDPALALTVNQLSGSEDEWLVSSASVASLLPSNVSAPSSGPLAQVLPVLQSIQSFNGGIKFGDNVALTGEITENSPQNATALNAVIKLAMIMLGSVSSNNSGNQQLANLLQVLQQLQVTTDGANVNLALSIPESQIESLINSAHPAVASLRQPAGTAK